MAINEYERDRLMNMVPATLPEAIDQWLIDECLREHHYMFYDKSTDDAYCSHCDKLMDRRNLTARIAKHNTQGNCPECGHKIEYICVGRFKRKWMKEDVFQIRVMQNTPEGIVIRRFELVRSFEKEEVRYLKPFLKWCELQRIFNNGETSRNYRHIFSYYSSDEDYWTESKKTDYNTISVPYGWSKTIELFEYRSNMYDVLFSSPLKYAAGGRDFNYYGGWLKQCEYLEKMGMKALVADIIIGRRGVLNFKATTIEKFLKIPKEYIKMAKDNNFCFYDLNNLRWLLKENCPKITPYTVKNLYTTKETYTAAKRIAPDINFNEFLNYSNKEKSSTRTAYYCDYLDFCCNLGYDLTDKSILYPHNLEEAHDREMKRVKIVKDKQTELKIKQILNDAVKKHNFATNEMFIRVPKSMKEIIDEGAALTHCVGNYCDRVADGLTMILFVRKQSEPDIPFYTVEFRDNKTIQIRGRKNVPPTPEVAEFMKEWENRNKKKTKQKIKVAI